MASNESRLDALHAATALHRLARLGGGGAELLLRRLAEPGALDLGAARRSKGKRQNIFEFYFI